MSRRPGLFPPPQPEIPDLSAALAAPTYRLRVGETATWTRIHVRTIDCEECSMVQHERAGAFGPRRTATHRRKRAIGPRLDLCSAHAHRWLERDSQDTVHAVPGVVPGTRPTRGSA